MSFGIPMHRVRPMRLGLRRLTALGALAAPLLGVAACAAPTAPAYESVRLEAEQIAGARVVADPAASAGSSMGDFSNGTVTGTMTAPVLSTWVEIRARGDQCAGAPVMTVRVDGQTVATTAVSATTWTTYGWAGTWAAGAHRVSVVYANDYQGPACDRNLRLDYFAFRSAVRPPAPPPSPAPANRSNPFAGASFYVDPHAAAAVGAATARSGGDPATAALLDKIAGQPQADWFTDAIPISGIAAAAKARVDTIMAAGRLPVLVSYAIPGRDCGGQSAGGVRTSADYSAWIGNLASGIGTRRAVVVLEPDSVALWDCLDTAAQTARVTDLRNAVAALTASGSVAVYLDGGHSGWQPVATMAARLTRVGTDKVRGFATDVANFNPTTAETAYGNQLAAALGTHYVVDTSRNGAGPASSTCNPAGQALGVRPTAATSSPSADAYFWIKRPGESDGACAPGEPAAGAWYASYAVGLASRAAW